MSLSSVDWPGHNRPDSRPDHRARDTELRIGPGGAGVYDRIAITTTAPVLGSDKRKIAAPPRWLGQKTPHTLKM
ncbi:hypothetical protein NE852_31995 (plasmid) [Rhizobium sp. Pop5]|uniref:hypothetical protein n=1 Tax=Rhizobium sp. Pop5 TaxID=1223565 RepID=UPI000B27F08A|nr:hypothetical protein [Rhizobium sp. Pop5]UVD60369.1 hypothetical protein NE852_31995 [Rhizobium sp. Pop5]